MNQLAIDFDRHPFAPIEPTARKTLRILRALQAGERLTVAEALSRYQVFALSQEIGRLERLGWHISSRTVKTAGGAHVSEYFMAIEREPGCDDE